MSSDVFPKGELNTITRSDRASYDRDAAYAILDEALHCSVGIVDDGRPVVIPMLHVRIEDRIVLHGSPNTRLFEVLVSGAEVCITATLLDGLVLARSAFSHSANYRSVVVFGRSRPVTGEDDRRAALDLFTDKLVPGRRPTLRQMTDKEVRATSVIEVPIETASVKARSGPPHDTARDTALPIWAGVIPVSMTYGSPIPAPDLHPDATAPEHLGFFTA